MLVDADMAQFLLKGARAPGFLAGHPRFAMIINAYQKRF
jgi:hypothetical protein